MLIADKVKVKWVASNKKHFESKGYTYTKIYDEFEVYIFDLMPTSSVKIDVKCDYCGNKIKKTYMKFKKGREKINKDCCGKCTNLKKEEIFLIEHGVKNPFQLEETKEKSKKTNLERYGVENYTQTEECQEKKKKTTLERYGKEHYSQTDEHWDRIKTDNLEKYGVEYFPQTNEFKEKVKKTNLERYGFEHSLQSEEVKNKRRKTNLQKYGFEEIGSVPEVIDKRKNTMLERYGVETPLQNPDIKAKMTATLYKNGTVPTSSQQLEVYEMLKENGYNVKLNYPVSSVNLDVAIFIDSLKIDLEYDGSYWHQDEQKDRKRDEFLKSQGWKILRIKSRRKVPSLNDVVSSINKLVSTDREFTQLILDDWKENSVKQEVI